MIKFECKMLIVEICNVTKGFLYINKTVGDDITITMKSYHNPSAITFEIQNNNPQWMTERKATKQKCSRECYDYEKVLQTAITLT